MNIILLGLEKVFRKSSDISPCIRSFINLFSSLNFIGASQRVLPPADCAQDDPNLIQNTIIGTGADKLVCEFCSVLRDRGRYEWEGLTRKEKVEFSIPVCECKRNESGQIDENVKNHLDSSESTDDTKTESRIIEDKARKDPFDAKCEKTIVDKESDETRAIFYGTEAFIDEAFKRTCCALTKIGRKYLDEFKTMPPVYLFY